jgi:hypothetical protein
MLIHNFRAAVKKQGKYCPVKNELRVRKGKKVYRFTCAERELRFAAPACAEVVICISHDATVGELRRGISSIIDLHETRQRECSKSF